MVTMRWKAGGVCGLFFALVGSVSATPPGGEYALTGSWCGSCRMAGTDSGTAMATAGEFALSVLSRKPLPWPEWYFSYGLLTEKYFFEGNQTGPQRLQDYAAILRLEYFRGDQIVAQLSLQPGVYFEQHVTTQSWDIPVELVTGIPLTTNCNGVLGFNNGRFFHHPLPICGVVWQWSPVWRWELVFPEPALVYTGRTGQQWRLGGELSGGGFRGDAQSSHTVIVYSSYRIGVEWSQTSRTGPRMTIGVGVEAARSFDFFHARQRLHGGGAGYLKTSFAFAP